MPSETLATSAVPTPVRPRNNFPLRESGAMGAVLCGFFLRLAAILVLHTYKFHSADPGFAFGYETGRIGAALASGQGFSNPFHGLTGPTAWEAPLYPFLVGLVFKLTGLYTSLSAFLLLTVNSIFSALTAAPIYWIAKDRFGSCVAKWSAWTWALLPYTMYWATRWVWETSLTAFLLTTAFWLALRLNRAQGRQVWKTWAWFGFVWGLIALTNPACLSFLPFAGGWACYRLARHKEHWFCPALLSALIFLAAITPWELRNYRVFHHVIPIRDNGGAELRMGNGPDAAGLWMVWLHPTQNLMQYRLYREMGEFAYTRMRGREALTFMRRNPRRTALLWGTKAFYYWAGLPRLTNPPALAPFKNSLFLVSSVLAWWGLGLLLVRRQSAFLFAALLVVYPLTYYIAFPHARYRHPIEPILLILGVYLVSQTRELRARATATAEEIFVPEPEHRLTTLSIVVPCYNEKKTLRTVIATVMAAQACGLQKEIVIVDDCSADGTRDLLPQLEAEYRDHPQGVVRVFYHDRNQGKGAAVRTGFAKVGGDLVLVQDADLEYDPADYEVLLAPILNGRADAVFGNRFHGGAHRVLYFWHYQANRLLTLLCNVLSDLNLSDMEVGYKVFRREILQQMTLKANRFGFEPEVTIKTAKLGCRLYEVPISYHGRTYDEGKKIGWKDGVAALWHMVKYKYFD
jgi:hypothetical protein